jgi:hypothetical protein
VEIKDDKQIVDSFKIFSQYYLNSSMPEQLTVNFSGLPTGKKLTAQVKAIDSYNDQSMPIVSKTFKVKETKAQKGESAAKT